VKTPERKKASVKTPEPKVASVKAPEHQKASVKAPESLEFNNFSKKIPIFTDTPTQFLLIQNNKFKAFNKKSNKFKET
jgi:hypothetical protein